MTRKAGIIACSLVAITWLAVYSWIGGMYTTITTDKGHIECAAIESDIILISISLGVWSVFYVYIPAILLLTMNTAIVAKLKKAQSAHFSLTSITRSSVSLNSPIVTDDGFHIETETQRNFGNGPAWWQKHICCHKAETTTSSNQFIIRYAQNPKIYMHLLDF